MTLIFNTLLEVVEVHVYPKFLQAKCSGLRNRVNREKEKKTLSLPTILKTVQPWLPRAAKKTCIILAKI